MSAKRPYRVCLGQYTKVVDAECAEAAVLEACRTMGSVFGLVAGAEFTVFPTEFEKTVLVQYERPLAEGGDMGVRMPDYGRPQIVQDFIETPEAEGLFWKA